MTDLTVTMLSLNHPDYMARVAGALDKQIGILPSMEILLVNNGGCQQTRDAVAGRPGWRIVEPGYNTSYAEGHNTAARLARGEYLLQLNDDCIPEETFIESLWRSREAADVIGGLQLYPDGRVNHAGGHLVPWPDHDGRGAPRERYHYKGLLPTEWVTGAVLLIRRELFLSLGGLDEIFWYGSEDCDLCLRALDRGARIAVNTNAVSVHGELGTRPGGAADLPNEAIFRSRWLARLPEMAGRAHNAWSRHR